MAQVEEKGSKNGRDDYTEDATVSFKGLPVLRSKTGRWRACSFIVGDYKFRDLKTVKKTVENCK
uniref:Uncharacterized protein n=1 Tax=Cucumis melo TaxID=3656 RepID=A0A9I9DQW3_CUCME